MTTNTATARTQGTWHVVAIKAGRIVGDETAADFDKLQIHAANATIATVYRAKDARLIATAPALLAALKQMCVAFPPPKMRAANGFAGNLAHAVAGTAIHQAATE